VWAEGVFYTRNDREDAHRKHPFLLAPDAGAIGPDGFADALIEQSLPVLGRVHGQSLHVVLYVKKATILTPVDDLVQGVLLAGVAGKRDKLGAEQLAVLQGNCGGTERRGW